MTTSRRAYRYRETDVPFRAAAVLPDDAEAHDWAAGLATLRRSSTWVLEVRHDRAWYRLEDHAPARRRALLRPGARA